MFGKFIAGISFADDMAHLAVFKARKHSVSLRYLAEVPRNGTGELWFLDELLSGKSRVLRKISRAEIALDRSAAFVHCFPSDTSLSGPEEQNQISWELSNVIPKFNPEEYAREKHLLQTHAHRQYSDLMIVAYRKAFLERAREALGQKKIALAGSITNLFGAQHALVLNNPGIRTKSVALVHVMKDRIEVGILNRGRIAQYRVAEADSPAGVVERVRAAVESFPVSDLYFYGSGVTSALLSEAKDRLQFGIAALNPFREVPVSSSFREFDTFSGKEHRFAAAVGSALRER